MLGLGWGLGPSEIRLLGLGPRPGFSDIEGFRVGRVQG